jgi:CcmD family protein
MIMKVRGNIFIVVAVMLLLFAGIISILVLGGQQIISLTIKDSGKIFVVIAVLLVIFAGIVTYLALLERKIKKLEKEINDKKTN